MTDFGPRVCWFCGRGLVDDTPAERQAVAHCPSGGCHWCRDCEQERRGQQK